MSIFGDFTGIGSWADLAKSVIQLIPNAEQRAQAAAKAQDLEAQIAASQSATNTAEATGGLFIAGWRPALGWVCVAGFTWSIVDPVLHGKALDTVTLNSLLWGMLGLGAYRTADKLGGVATTAIKKIIGR